MSQHLKNVSNRPLPPHGLQLGEAASSAFFKPIVSDADSRMRGSSQTDEEKSSHLIKPTPSIFINDSEMQLSPLAPPSNRGSHTSYPFNGGKKKK